MLIKLLKSILFTLLGLVVLSLVFLAYMTWDDYQPEAVSLVSKSADAEILQVDSPGVELEIISWNIGYAGLHNTMDFFYSGGKQVYPSKEIVEENFAGILNFLQGNPVDFFLLQEVDRYAQRSHFIQQPEKMVETMKLYRGDFARNYDVAFVPLPLYKPMGRVESGLLTLSKHPSSEAMRHSFEANFSWPMGLFMLDRCFLVNRYPMSNGHDLVLINTHNSAYDDGTLRERQMEQISAFLETEYQKGNAVIVGGDWNQCPPSFVPAFKENKMDNVNRKDIPDDFMPQWTWAYDNTQPTNRRNFMVYRKGETPTTVIDFFLLSPNVELIHVENIGMDFRWSDHQPVKIRVRIGG